MFVPELFERVSFRFAALFALLLLFAASPSAAAVPAPAAFSYVSSFAGAGPNEGYSNPVGVAVLPARAGFVVVDRGLHRATIQDENGALLHVLGSGLGTAPGQFRNPIAAAVAPNGDILIADTDNDRVQRFSSAGLLLQVFGNDPSGPGRLQHPTGVASAPGGGWYVVDQWNHRVVRYSASGGFVVAWGSLGDGPGQFNYPSQVAVDRRGQVYVSDLLNHRVQKFSANGVWLRAWGSAGTGPGQFTSPTGIAIDATGAVFVADAGASNIQRFTDAGVWQATFSGPGTAPGFLRGPIQLASPAAGKLLVADETNHVVDLFSNFAASLLAADDPVGLLTDSWSLEPLDPFINMNGIAADDHGGAFVVDMWHSIWHLAPGGSVSPRLVTGSGSAASGRALWPSIAYRAGRMYVTDPDRNRILMYDTLGTTLGTFGGSGTALGTLNNPDYLRFDDAGNLNVLNGFGTRVDRFTAAGAFVSRIPVTAASGAMDASGDVELTTITQQVLDFGTSLFIGDGVLQRYAPSASLTPLVPHLGTTEWGSVVTVPGRGTYISERKLNAIRRYDARGVLRGRLVLPAATKPYAPDLSDMDATPNGDLLINDRYEQVVRKYSTPAQPIALTDRLEDDGSRLILHFRRSSSDAVNATPRAFGYQVLRKLDGALPPDPHPVPGLPDWEVVATVNATAAEEYTVEVPTIADATPAGLMLSTFMVRTLTDPWFAIESSTITGSSIDDLAPGAPQGLAATLDGTGVALHWRPQAPPVAAYRIYRGAAPGFDISEASLVASTPDTGYLDIGAGPAAYAVTAVDPAGNESAPSQVGPSGLLGAPSGTVAPRFALSGVFPNPSSGERLAVHFSLSGAAPAELQLFDASGRRVVSEAVGHLGAGLHRLELRPARPLPPGLYLVRLQSGADARNSRVVILQ